MTPELIQSFMDAGKTLSEISRYFDVHHQIISRIIKRHNLEWYEAFDEEAEEGSKLWFYDDQFKLFKSEYGYENKEDCMRDAIGEFVHQYDPDEITIELLKSYRHIEQYSYKIFGSLPEMYKYFGIDKTAVEYSMNKRTRACASWGHLFEELVAEVFSELNYRYERRRRINDCVPDFIVGDSWYDAKLSRNTAFNSSCQTIEKYRKHTDYLTIIYALHDTEKDDERATFVHITEIKPLVSPHLQRKIDAFIRKASEVRFGESNRLSDGQVRYDSAESSA